MEQKPFKWELVIGTDCLEFQVDTNKPSNEKYHASKWKYPGYGRSETIYVV